MTTLETPSTDRPSSRLAAACTGAVLVPGDDGFDAACTGWNLTFTHRPAVVVRAATEADVVAAVRHAAAQDLTVVVQATGHGVTIPADERCLLLLTGALDEVHLDVAARTATVGGGATWTGVLARAQEHGLAPLLGSAPHVGAVGYTLGGGSGWLGRRHGLAVDSVRELRVVLADGEVVTTSPYERAELFWAMCGAGAGSLGVVVSMTVELAPVAEVYAGSLYYPLDAAPEVFDRYRAWTDDAPDELTSACTIASFPPLEIVPEPLRGRTFTIVRGCHLADHETAAASIDRWRSWQAPLIDAWGPMPFARCAEISQDPVDPVPAASSGRWLADLDGEVLEVMRDAFVGDGPPGLLFAEVRHAGGAISRPNPQVSYAARDVAFSLELVGLVTGPEAAEALHRRFAWSWERLASQQAELPGYLNFADGEERIAVAPSAFDADRWRRLTAIKRVLDPDDRFRHGVLGGISA